MGTTSSPWAIDRVKITLLLSLIFIYVAPFIPALSDRLVASTSCLLGVLALLALLKKHWCDAGLAIAIALIFIIARQKFDVVPDETFVFRTTGILAFLLLHVTLLIGPLSRFSKIVRKWYIHRRHIGVTTFLLALFHESLILKVIFKFSIEKTFALQYVFFGIIAFSIMLLLALTSWDHAQTKISLKWWNIIHIGSLVSFIGISIYFLSVNTSIMTWHYVLLALFCILWILFAPWGIARKIHKRVNGWKQIHFLVYISYIAMIIHVWVGRAQFQDNWIQIIFWGCVAAVTLAHLSGWIKWAMVRSKRKKIAAGSIEVEGVVYHRVGKTSDFIEGKGKEITIEKTILAIFKQNGTYIAISGICPHQGGAIAQGTIENGYIVCPLHKWQYSIADGASPEGYSDCIPYYKTMEKNGSVYVALSPNESCVIQNGQYTKKEAL